jgi:hypothetical protein
MAKARGHSWQFKTRFRRHAFGWKSQPAIARLHEAVSEIAGVREDTLDRIRSYVESPAARSGFAARVLGPALDRG